MKNTSLASRVSRETTISAHSPNSRPSNPRQCPKSNAGTSRPALMKSVTSSSGVPSSLPRTLPTRSHRHFASSSQSRSHLLKFLTLKSDNPWLSLLSRRPRYHMSLGRIRTGSLDSARRMNASSLGSLIRSQGKLSHYRKPSKTNPWRWWLWAKLASSSP